MTSDNTDEAADIDDLQTERRELEVVVRNLLDDPEATDLATALFGRLTDVGEADAGGDGEVVIALNFTPVVREYFPIGLPMAGAWRECMNTDSDYYGGSGQGNLGRVVASIGAHQGQPASATIRLPPLGGVILEREPDDA